jgi:hypothetical protein
VIGARLAVAAVAVVLVGGSLTGCAHGMQAENPAPPAGVAAASPSPTPAAGVSDSTLQDIQGDLTSSDSSVAGADGDVADADSSAATSDSP